MNQNRIYPCSNQSTLTIATYAFTSTGPSGTITMSGGVNASALVAGQSIFLGGFSSTGGFVPSTEYFVIPVASGSIQIATSKANALNGTFSSASGNVSGTIYPTYEVGGVLYVGASGDVNARGIDSSVFSVLKNVPAGTRLPFMFKDVSASGTTATYLVPWNR